MGSAADGVADPLRGTLVGARIVGIAETGGKGSEVGGAVGGSGVGGTGVGVAVGVAVGRGVDVGTSVGNGVVVAVGKPAGNRGASVELIASGVGLLEGSEPHATTNKPIMNAARDHFIR